MANFKKSFNFRHGVQVDDDNFIVDTLGKVGIGSTIPAEILDVAGNAKVSGSVTVDSLSARVVTTTGVSDAVSFNILNVGITSLTNGIITSTSGIVTYYGDARYLEGMPTSQWVDTDVGLGFTSIYAAGNVGVGTTDPRYSFQVGDTNSSGVLVKGIGINTSDGNLRVVGICSATEFLGPLSGVANTASDLTSTAKVDINTVKSVDSEHTGVSTFNKISIKDSSSENDNRLYFGNSSVLGIYHDGTDSYISNTGQGNLVIDSDSSVEIKSVGTGESIAKFTKDAGVELYWNGGKKFEIIQDGVHATDSNLHVGLSTDASTNTPPNISIRKDGLASLHVRSNDTI